MEPTWENPLASYVKHFDGLIGDRRTRKTFGEIVKGIIGAGSLICQQMQQEHLVVRLSHTDRKVAFQDRQGQWHQGDIAQATAHLRPLARVETTLEVKGGKQVRPKKQPEALLALLLIPHKRCLSHSRSSR